MVEKGPPSGPGRWEVVWTPPFHFRGVGDTPHLNSVPPPAPSFTSNPGEESVFQAQVYLEHKETIGKEMHQWGPRKGGYTSSNGPM